MQLEQSNSALSAPTFVLYVDIEGVLRVVVAQLHTELHNDFAALISWSDGR
jgi:hypothetical protein